MEPTSTNPLSYQALKTVLFYMDPAMRFQVSQAVPSIRITEKLLPIKINRLAFGQMTIKVNDTEFKLGVHRHYSNSNRAFPDHQTENVYGGSIFELDKYGLRSVKHNEKVQGDIGNEAVHRNQNSFPHSHTGHEIQESLHVLEVVLEDKKANYKLNKEKDQNWINTEEAKKLLGEIREKESEVEKKKGDLMSHFYGTNTTKVPLKPYLQLTTTNPGRPLRIEYMEYSENLHDAFRYLTKKLFGMYRATIKIEVLEIQMRTFFVPLPANLKFHVDRVETGSFFFGRGFRDLVPLLAEDCQALKDYEKKMMNTFNIIRR